MTAVTATQTLSTTNENANSDNLQISSSPPPSTQQPPRSSPPGPSMTSSCSLGFGPTSRLSDQHANKSSMNTQPRASQSNTQLCERSLTEVIEDKFPPFDHHGLVVGPFTEETARDATFEQALGTMLLDVILETHAWAAARPKHESHLAVQRLENKIGGVIELEQAQGMLPIAPLQHIALAPSWPAFLFEQTRKRLNQFIIHMKSALAVLTGS